MRYGALIEKTKTGFSAYVPCMMESGDAIPEPTSKLVYVEVQLAS